MKALDFINKEIEGCIKNIEFCEYKGWDSPEHNQRLIDLKEVKEQLEAWEVVKHTIYKRKIGEERYIQVMGSVYNDGQCWSSGINPYEIVKKALEVKDE